MAILSTNQRLINVGDSYSAGNGIDITNNIISVTGDNAPYSAGQNIYFNGDDNHVINGKDWGSEINDASANAYNVTTAWVQDNYANSADVSYLSGVIDNKLDTSAWSSVSSNFATEDYVIVADNITYDRAKGYVDSKGYATEEFVNENTSGKLESTAFDTWRNGQYSTDLQTIEGQIANKLDSSSFSDVSGTFYPTTNPSSFVNEDWVTAQGYITGVDLSEYAKRDFVLSSVESSTSGKLDVSSFASVSSDFLTTSFEIPESATWNETSNVVQTNSAQWAEGGGAITSYTTAYSHDIPPYGGEVIDSLNEKKLSAFVSLSADNAKVATNANSATYAQTVDETKLENDGFVKNLTSEYGTISVVRNTIESTNSAISRVGNEGFVSSFNDAESIGPAYTATYSWDKSLPNTEITLDMGWNNGYTLSYSANTELTGEVVLPVGQSTQTINIPNATEFLAWANDWVSIEKAVVSADDSFETVVGELAWASALPIYEYDITNKISAINGSAIAAGDEFPASADEAIQCVQSNSSNWQSVSNKLDSDVFTAWSANQADNNYQLSAGDGISIIDDDINKITRIDVTAQYGDMFTAYLEYNDQNQISGYNGSAFAGQGGGGNPEVENYVQTNSAGIDDTITNVTTNSGAWGGSALPISAGPGIKVNLVDNTLVFSNDETVLYSDLTGRPTTVGSYIDLSESPLNFYYIGIYLNGSTPTGSNNISNGYEKVPVEQLSSSNGLEFLKEFVGTVAGNISTVHDMGCGYSGTSGTRWTKWYGYSYNVQNKNVDFDNNTHLNIWKVIGINRR